MTAHPEAVKQSASQRELVCEQLRLLDRELGRRPNVADYNQHRIRENKKRGRTGGQQIPSMSAVYRMFDKWPLALAAAGIVEPVAQAVRASDAELLHDLRYVAAALGTDELSTSRYDAYRKTHTSIVCGITGRQRRLYSSSVIRKWLHDWPDAVARAGLRTTGKQQRRPPRDAEVLDWVRRAHLAGFSIDPGGWLAFLEALEPEERKHAPEPNTVIDRFLTWDNARRAIGDDSDTIVYPHWFRSEIEYLIRSQLQEQLACTREQARQALSRG